MSIYFLSSIGSRYSIGHAASKSGPADDGPKSCEPKDAILPDGTQEIIYADCRNERVSIDGTTTTTTTTYPDGTKVLHREDAALLKSTSITTKPDGTTITEEVKVKEKTITIEMPDGQKAVRTPNGIVITTFPDGKVTSSHPKGSITTSFPDGRIITDYQENYQGEEFAGFKYKPKQDVFNPATGETTRTSYGTEVVLILKNGRLINVVNPGTAPVPQNQ
jgi:hypothetical protein